MIKVKYTSVLRRDIGREIDRIRAKSVSELIDKLIDLHGEVFKNTLPECSIFVNGSSTAYLDGLNTGLADGDEVIFMLPVAGG